MTGMNGIAEVEQNEISTTSSHAPISNMPSVDEVETPTPAPTKARRNKKDPNPAPQEEIFTNGTSGPAVPVRTRTMEGNILGLLFLDPNDLEIVPEENGRTFIESAGDLTADYKANPLPVPGYPSKSYGNFESITVEYSHSSAHEFKLVYGYRRTAAAIAAGMYIKAELLPTGADQLLTNIRENAKRKDLSALDKANLSERLKAERQMSMKEIAAIVNVTPGMLTQIRSALVAPVKVQRLLHEGKVSITTIYEISKETDEKKRDKQWQKLVDGQTMTRANARASAQGDEDGESEGEGGAAPKKKKTIKMLLADIGNYTAPPIEAGGKPDLAMQIFALTEKFIAGKIGGKALDTKVRALVD